MTSLKWTLTDKLENIYSPLETAVNPTEHMQGQVLSELSLLYCSCFCSHNSPSLLGGSPQTTKLSCWQVYVFLKWLPLDPFLLKTWSLTVSFHFISRGNPFLIPLPRPLQATRLQRGEVPCQRIPVASRLTLNVVNLCTFLLEFTFLDSSQVCLIYHYRGGSVILYGVLPTLYLKISTGLRTESCSANTFLNK